MKLISIRSFGKIVVIAGCYLTSVVCILIVSPAGAGQPGIHIPSLNAKVTALYFFESGINYEGAPYGKRNYKTEFLKSSTRYVNWELNLKYPKPGRRIDFEIVAKLYGPDDSEFRKQIKNAYMKSNWDNSSHSRGWGNRKPGKFGSVGTYRVDLYIAGDMVASDTFEVVSDEGEITAPTGKPGRKIDIPDDLGEL